MDWIILLYSILTVLGIITLIVLSAMFDNFLPYCIITLFILGCIVALVYLFYNMYSSIPLMSGGI